MTLAAKLNSAAATTPYNGSAPAAVVTKTRALTEVAAMLADESKAVLLLTETTLPQVMKMLQANLLRALKAPKDDFDPDQDLPEKDPAWVHLVVVYEILTSVIQAPIAPRLAKRHITPTFCCQLIGLLRSQDQDERLAVATILHKLYAKFKSLRASFRQTVGYTFLQFVEEPSLYPFGIGELLEVFASIVKGFATPLLPDHATFMAKHVLPLLKPTSLPSYHQPLLLCLTMYLEKDPKTVHPLLSHLVKYWPWQATSKQILFINTLEETLELTPIEEVSTFEKRQIAAVIAKCLQSHHFQVAERTLFLWNNPYLINHSLLNQDHARELLPIFFPALFKAFKLHWNITVRGLARSVLEMYTKYDFAMYRRCLENYEADQLAILEAEDKKEAKWKALFERVSIVG
ncbi:protein phosphatase 2A regulatory B subunit [Achlya hypogyna]|uniref:Protein phosphatase 2A regulatory B subunit n=1 Tax=Achlya hypogyna TaxID=1202772 RepID=A0A1V9YLS6_ACHHY|nr:protein phosphatase 2A regulatory B subunit [Achlya hypogyna]